MAGRSGQAHVLGIAAFAAAIAVLPFLLPNEYYLTVLIVAGQVTEREVMREVNKIFGKVSRGKKTGKAKVKENQNHPAVLINFKKTDQTHFVLGVRSLNLFNKKVFIFCFQTL